MRATSRKRRAAAGLAAAGLGLVAAACGTPSAKSSTVASVQSGTMTEYVAGRWVPFTSSRPLTSTQWSVVDGYASFTSAALAVYATHSTAPLSTVVSPQSQSGVTTMFAHNLASGTRPEAVYVDAKIESVAISGCRATLKLELFYPGGRTLQYKSSWVLPFNPKALARARVRYGPKASFATLLSTQHAQWLFVGDNRVGGMDTPCGI